MNLEELVKIRRKEILDTAAKYGAQNVRVFGSVARGEAKADSDLDLLVSMEQGRSFLDLVGLWQELEETLNIKVEVISEAGVSPYLKDRIFAEARQL